MPTATINVRIGDTSAINASATPDATINVAIGAPGPQGPPGSGGGGGGSESFDGENRDSVTFAIGAPLAANPTLPGVVRANATDTTRPCVGLASVGVSVGSVEAVQTGGTITRTNWTSVTGSSLLSVGAGYYLHTTAGQLRSTVPTTPGQVVQYVGRALTSQTLLIEIDQPIEL